SLGKRVLLSICFVLLFFFQCNAQKSPSDTGQFYGRPNSLTNQAFKNPSPLNRSIPFKQSPFLNRQSFIGKQLPVNHKIFSRKNEYKIGGMPSGPVCIDTSLRLVYRKDSSWFANDNITKTKDGNILIPGWDYNIYTREQDAHLVKCTQQGDTLWSISIQGGYPNLSIDAYKAFELNDGSILLAGNIDVPMPINGRSDFMMLRVTATGNLIWEKTLKSKFWDSDTTNGSIDIYDCIQDVAGNLYLGGNIHHLGPSRAALGFKMDLAGNILWSRGFVLGSAPVITGINIVNQKVTFFGTAFSGIGDLDCFAIAADAFTGDTLSSKYLVPGNNDGFHSFFENNMVKLNNGNLALFGPGGLDNVISPVSQAVTHSGIIEVTPDFDVVRSYLFRSQISDVAYTTRITVFGDGSAAYGSSGVLGSNQDVTLGSFKNGQVIKERVIPYRGMSVGWMSNFIQLDDGGQLLTNFTNDAAAQSSYIEMLRLHNSDTSGSCLGTDTVSTFIEAQTFHAAIPYIDSVSVDILSEDPRPFKGVFNDHFIINSNCRQINFCDTLHLSVSRDTVCENVPVNINVKKNKECGTNPLWTYDTTAVSSFYKLNDSTMQVVFNKPWQGIITGIIDGCKTLADSVKLTVLEAPAKLDIGPDTTICPGNTILLNAKRGYKTYKWQDGSVD